jgi:hypothetical protein
VLGNSPQEKAHGRQVVGRRLPVVFRGSTGGKAGAGRLPERIIHGSHFEIAALTCLYGTKLAEKRGIEHRAKGFAVAFIVHASKGEDATTTIRLSVVVAIAKGRSLAEEGWQVFITGPDGHRYHPAEFDRLLSLSTALHSRP